MNAYPQYLNLAIPATRRLEILRHSGAAWCDARRWGFHNAAGAFCTLSQGFNGKTPVWYTHTGPEFGDRFADEILSLRHTGWHTDAEFGDTARGIVGKLPHGRYIAGYYLSMNGERVYFGEVFDDERDAAHAADGHAQHSGELESAHAERFRAMSLAELDVENKTLEVEKAIALRHREKFGGKPRVIDAIEELRSAREELQRATKDFENA